MIEERYCKKKCKGKSIEEIRKMIFTCLGIMMKET